jgi:aminopeptidase N
MMRADPELATGGLTAAEAAARSALVEVHSYQVELDLTDLPSGDGFGSRTVIDFAYGRRNSGGPGMTWIDLVAEEVSSVILDGTTLDPAVVRGNRVRLGPLGGCHRVEVIARHRTGVPGRGLSRSIDPADGEVYAWTQFQPFDARRVFACFDQPDLKASFTFVVRLPSEWQCVSGQLESSVIEGENAAVWTFPATPRLPTYATAVCAGPFHVVRSAAGPIPMALYARRSLAQPLERNAAEIFDLNRRALELFGTTFGRPYDGDSYDHVFLPDQPGAMENHGCVTWNDQVLYRSEPTAEQRRRRALVQLHEMSHMWFGNLVTPQWWDGLWLSESFADWAAQWAAAELGILEGRWSVVTALEKERAAGADLLTSTHPVSRPVPDLAAAEATFDLITYAKGACMLRQLVGLVGQEQFLAGLREYFEQLAGGNGSLAALIDAMASVTPIDLAGWSREWLESSGINTLSLAVDAVDGRYVSAAVIQSPVELTRRHDVAIGVYRVDFQGLLSRVDRIELEVAGERTDVPGLVGLPVADLLLLDDSDTAYAILRPDERSMRALVSAGGRLAEPVARTVVRRTLRGLLLDGLLPAAEVVDYVARALPSESDPTHLKALATLGAEASGPYAPASQRTALQRRLASTCVSALQASQTGSDEWLILVEALADFADTDDLKGLLAEGDLPQPIRWRLLIRLVALGAAGPEVISVEQARDADPDAQWYAAAALAAAPTPIAKDAALDLLLTGAGIPAAVLPTFGPALWQPRQTSLLAGRTSRFLDQLTVFGQQAGWPAAHRVVRYAFPAVGINDAFVQRALAIAAAPDLPPLIRTAIQDQAEQSKRALASARETSDGLAARTSR